MGEGNATHPGSFEHTFLSSIKDSWRRWQAENRAVTVPVIQRSMLEHGPWFCPVLLHEGGTAFAPFASGLWFCKGGLGREQWSCGGTGFGDTAQFWFNSKSVMLSEVAGGVNYWSSSSSSDDCWDAFSSFSCDIQVHTHTHTHTHTQKRVVKFQLHPERKCLPSGINAGLWFTSQQDL